ncbi:MAG TPA: iron-sulfur cluster assembly accessory protein [Flavipsychrobacter sp.]|nr:iron-sulfur cluster assembly accessory protein [Flavipsychrobacter sp.]
METLLETPVRLTESAVKEIKRLMNEPAPDQGEYLRIGVKGGGCSGLSYVLGFDKKEDDDQVYDMEGIPVIVKTAHSIYLFGIVVNFDSGLNARGFTFTNPNASTTCGCGSSFAV